MTEEELVDETRKTRVWRNPRELWSVTTEARSSESINELAAALAKAQGEMHGASTDSTNPHYRSSYADLDSCWRAARAPLSKHGLAVIQTTRSLDAATLVLDTTLVHTSGQWVLSTYPIRPVKDDPQGYGSALTYARRYSFCAIVGLSPAGDDDDGNAASSSGPIDPGFKKPPVRGTPALTPLKVQPRPIAPSTAGTSAKIAFGPQQTPREKMLETPNRPISADQQRTLKSRTRLREEATGTPAKTIADQVMFVLGIEEGADGKYVVRMGKFDEVLAAVDSWTPEV